MSIIQAVRWSPDGEAVRIIDQRRLPIEEVTLDLRTREQVCDAIRTLAVRGAPAIGVAGAMGLVASLGAFVREGDDEFRSRLAHHAAAIRETRPTAVNLPWAIDRMLAVASAHASLAPAALHARLHDEATAILDE